MTICGQFLSSLTESAGTRFISSDFTLSVDFHDWVQDYEGIGAFTWAFPPPDNAYAAFVGRLMHFSRVLDRKGIKIVDCEGRTGFDRN